MALYEQKRTTFSTQDYADAVYAADSSLTREQAGVLWAQYAIETGRGKGARVRASTTSCERCGEAAPW